MYRRLLEVSTLDAAPQIHADGPKLMLWLGTPPPPYVAHVNLLEETVVVRNPAQRHAVDLSGHSIRDKGRKHLFEFPSGFTLQPQTEVTISCSPGLLDANDLEERRAVPHLLWRTAQGHLRKAHVLNDLGDTVLLLDEDGREVAACAAAPDGTIVRHLPRLRRTTADCFRGASAVLVLLRAALLLWAVIFAFPGGASFRAALMASHVVDLACRSLARHVTPRGINVLANALSFAGDRVAVLALAKGLTSRSPGILGNGLLLLDVIASSVDLMAAAAAAQYGAERELRAARRQPRSWQALCVAGNAAIAEELVLPIVAFFALESCQLRLIEDRSVWSAVAGFGALQVARRAAHAAADLTFLWKLGVTLRAEDEGRELDERTVDAIGRFAAGQHED